MDNKEMIEKVKKNEESKGFFTKLIDTLNKKISKRRTAYMGTMFLTTAISIAALLAGGLTLLPIGLTVFDLGVAIAVTGYGVERNAKDKKQIQELQSSVNAINQENKKIKREFDMQNFASKEPITNYQKHIYRKHVKVKQTEDDLAK